MIDRMVQKSTSKVISRIVTVLLIVLLIGLFFANHLILDSAYNHINQHSYKNLLFSDYIKNPIFTSIHFLLPINMTNISLWGDERSEEAYYFGGLVLVFIVLSIMVVVKTNRKILYLVPIIAFVGLVSFAVFEVEGSPWLLMLNCIFYGISIYFFYIGKIRNQINYFLLGGFVWLLPNFYQLMFLEGLYI